MAKQTIDKLKSWFKTALKPTQQQFWDWMDSYWHKDEKIAIGNVDGLIDIVNNTASATVLNTVSERLNEHLNDTENPHNVTKEQIGLDLVDNTSDVDKPLSNAAIAEFNSINDAITNTLNTHVEDTNNPHHVTAAQVGLDKVNNTSDADKPISTATQTALNGKLSQGGDAFGAPVVVGSKDNNDFVVKANNTEQLRIQSSDGTVSLNGPVKIGTGSFTNGGILSLEKGPTFSARLFLRPYSNSSGFGSTYWGYIENTGYVLGMYAGGYQSLALGIAGTATISINSPGSVNVNGALGISNLKGVGSRVVCADSSGQLSANLNSVSLIADISTVAPLFTSTTINVTATGKQGQMGFDGSYMYVCIATNTWTRIPVKYNYVNPVLGDVDDSAGTLTSAQLNAIFPNARIEQKAYGSNSLYIKKTNTNWVRIPINYI